MSAASKRSLFAHSLRYTCTQPQRGELGEAAEVIVGEVGEGEHRTQYGPHINSEGELLG